MKKTDKEELNNIFIEIKNGNELEFNKLYEKYKNLVYGIAFSILKNKEDSEEITQTVFVKIFKLEKEKLPKEGHASWLYEVTKNEAITLLRNKKKEIMLDDIYYITNEANEINDIIDRETYNKIIQKLNPKEQEIVSLKILSNLSFKEIAKLLNIPVGTVQWRYYKAIHTLKLLLSNVSMFVIALTVLILKKFSIKKERNKEMIDQGITENTTDRIEEDLITKGQESTTEKKEMNVEEGQENTKNTVTIQTQENMKLTKIDIGIISVSVVFLVMTIISLLILIRYHKKAKKKVCKY